MRLSVDTRAAIVGDAVAVGVVAASLTRIACGRENCSRALSKGAARARAGTGAANTVRGIGPARLSVSIDAGAPAVRRAVAVRVVTGNGARVLLAGTYRPRAGPPIAGESGFIKQARLQPCEALPATVEAGMFFARLKAARYARAYVVDDIVGLSAAIIVQTGAAVARSGGRASGVNASVARRQAPGRVDVARDGHPAQCIVALVDTSRFRLRFVRVRRFRSIRRGRWRLRCGRFGRRTQRLVRWRPNGFVCKSTMFALEATAHPHQQDQTNQCSTKRWTMLPRSPGCDAHLHPHCRARPSHRGMRPVAIVSTKARARSTSHVVSAIESRCAHDGWPPSAHVCVCRLVLNGCGTPHVHWANECLIEHRVARDVLSPTATTGVVKLVVAKGEIPDGLSSPRPSHGVRGRR